MGKEPRLRLVPTDCFRSCVRRIDPEAERVQSLSERRHHRRLSFTFVEGPCVNDWHLMFEKARHQTLSHTDFLDAKRVAQDRVEIIVRDKMIGRRAPLAPGCRNVRCLEAFKPAEGGILPILRLRHPPSTIGAGDKRLKQTKGRRRPIITAVVTSFDESDLDN
jgi:hypothetical protein